MKKIILSSLTLLLLAALPQARAWTYNDNDLLLVFRKSGLPNVEFDLGSVSNLLNQPNGYTTTITGWDPSLVTGTFGSDLTGVKIVLLAATSRTNANLTAWLSGAEPNTTAYKPSLSTWSSSLQGIISAVGNKPLYPIAIPVTESNAYSIDPGGLYAASSYDYIVSGGTLNSKTIPSLGGNAPFKVEQTIPGSLDFWQIQPTTSSTPPPDHLVGTFYITTNGALTFVAGPRPTSITAVSTASGASAVSFNTVVGSVYSLAYTNALGGPISTWPVDATTNVVGNGKINTINHSTTGKAEFYNIEAQ
jgi:hypothetical protein